MLEMELDGQNLMIERLKFGPCDVNTERRIERKVGGTTTSLMVWNLINRRADSQPIAIYN